MRREERGERLSTSFERFLELFRSDCVSPLLSLFSLLSRLTEGQSDVKVCGEEGGEGRGERREKIWERIKDKKGERREMRERENEERGETFPK